MQDIYFKLKVLLEKRGKNEPLESPPRLGLICFKTFHLNLKKKIFILNLLHTYVVVLTLVTHYPCNRRCFLYIPLCLLTIQARVLKLDIHNLHHKKVSFAYTIFFPDVPTCPDIMKHFLISMTGFRNIEQYLKCNKKSHQLQSLCDIFR